MEVQLQECIDERWTRVNSTENSQEEDDNDEALSLRDLPQSTTQIQQHCTTGADHHLQQQDFDFCSFSKESTEMCAADEVFHQGQILPFRSSIRRSESMDHCSSGGLITSRSSSISSHNSSTSGSGSSTAADQKFPTRNLFHSHPSPSPKLIRNRIIGSRPNSAAKSSPWSVFRLGLVAPPPEIAFHDLKTRGPTGCRNGGGGEKRKIKAWDFLGGCKCAVGNDTVDAVPSKVVVMKRSASDGVAQSRGEEACLVEIKKSARKPSSHRRTSEWLKQLSIEGAPC